MRSVHWVEQDLSTNKLRWRQNKRELGGSIEYSDRHLEHTVEVVKKKATKTKPEVRESVGRYTDAEQKKLASAFDPLVKALDKAFGHVLWWHYDHPTGTLLYGRTGNERAQATQTDIRKIADQCFEKFTKALSSIHEKEITPGR